MLALNFFRYCRAIASFVGGLQYVSVHFVKLRVARILAIAVVCAGAFATVAQAAAPDPVELRVMSFNIRFSKVDNSEAASENNWADAKYPRRERAIRVIRENSPDLLGVQEARELQVEDLKKALPEYAYLRRWPR